MSGKWPAVRLGEVLTHRKEFITIDDLAVYKRPRVRLHAQGLVLRDEIPGALITTKKQQVCRAGEFLVAEIDAKAGGFGIVPTHLDGAIVSSHYFLFVADDARLDREYLRYFSQTRAFRGQIEAQGSTNYAAIRPGDVLRYEIPLPPIEEQRRLVGHIEQVANRVREGRAFATDAADQTGVLVGSAIETVIGRGWPLRPLAEVVDPHRPVTYGIVQAGDHIPDGVPYIRVSDMAKPQLTIHGMLRTSPRVAERYSRSAVRTGDIVFAIRATIGRMRVVPPELDGANLTQGTARIAPSDVALGPYLYWALQSRSVVSAIDEAAKGSTFREITLGRLRGLAIPLPPLPRQRQIIATLQTLEAAHHRLSCLQGERLAALDALLPSVLGHALSGQA